MRTSIVLAVGLAAALGQAGPRALVGTWTAEFGGQTIVRLELHESNGVLAGRISLGASHVNAQGELDDVIEAARGFTPILVLDVVFRDGVLSFARKDGDETDRFQVRRTGDVVHLVFDPTEEDRKQLAEAGLPIPKPVELKRVAR